MADNMTPNWLDETEMEGMLRDSARKFFSSHHTSYSGNTSRSRELWRAATEQGWAELSPHDEIGLAGAMILNEESGRAGVALPVAEAYLANLVDDDVESRSGSRDAIAWVLPDQAAWNNGVDSVSIDDTGRVSGRGAFVEHAAVADAFWLYDRQSQRVSIVRPRSPGVSMVETAGLANPAFSEVEFANVASERSFATTTSEDAMVNTLGLLLAARALGAASRGLELLVDYVKVRRQFGKQIGQFQAIQHKVADCFTALETVRLALRRAAHLPNEDGYSAGVALTLAGTSIRSTILELHHGFGGVSFWEGHEMPIHFRRAHADLVRLGGIYRARKLVARWVLREPEEIR